MRFSIYKDARGEYRWSLHASNGLRVADSGEGYVNKADCEHGIALTASVTSRTQFTFYRDVANHYRWRIVATNGRTIADCGEGYNSSTACEHGADLVISTNALTPIDDHTTPAPVTRRRL